MKIDIKPYIPNFDFVEGEIKSGWMNSSLDEVKNKKSDKRFLGSHCVVEKNTI
ncbi:hypothetical protein Q6A84_00360 [Aliarcobacter skirrowii]|uniref:hypothetical protein n=1 Tax=Aliarcobacter skirrowii TaxID=28200 RepID=UPI0029A4E904|nr:hypothetical protein [Aliarcobacter skirrowii]MDX4062640.1 hypothetical protein [Aliarcobacter skirrowii]